MRCYDGAPDSELRALLDNRERLRKLLPDGARCVYFPMEGKWMVWRDLQPLTDMCESAEEAMRIAIRQGESPGGQRNDPKR